MSTRIDASERTPSLLKRQRLAKARALLASNPTLTKREMAQLLTRELGLHASTTYAYLRELTGGVIAPDQ